MAEGYKDWSAGDILTAADLEDYTVKQSVMVFADASARTTALSSVLREGMVSYLKDTDSTEVYDGSAWAAVGGAGGLVFISRTTIGSAVSSVTVSNAFSADYDNYRIIVSGGATSGTPSLRMTLGGITTGYYWATVAQGYGTGSVSSTGVSNDAYFFVGQGHPNSLSSIIELQSPYLTELTHFQATSSKSLGSSSGEFRSYGGFLGGTTSVTDFDLYPSLGTMTGGTIDVYGYAKE